jgi:hypothetical protein
MYKLISRSPNDRFNVWAFLKNLKSDTYPNHNIPLEEITKWEGALEVHKKSIAAIGLLRKKIYAHTDPNIGDLDFDIEFKELQDLIEGIEEVIRGVYFHSFDSSIITDTPIFQNESFDIVKILADERIERWKKFKNS